MSLRENFWENYSLDELTKEEWEALCDGCGRCCLYKFQDEDTDEIFYSRVACKLLDTKSCACTDYPNRVKKVKDCLEIRKKVPEVYDWLPESCAYRRLSQGRKLASWHPLISKDALSVHRAGVSVSNIAIKERHGISPELYLTKLSDPE